jgi:hypothetical protein
MDLSNVMEEAAQIVTGLNQPSQFPKEIVILI